MNPAARHRSASDHFLALAELGEPARAEALERLRARDPDLAEAVARLLEADAGSTVTAIDRPAAWPFPLPGNPPAQLHGDRGYRLLEELGRGGMGTVWLAERADGEFHQRVAIKLLHPRAGDAAQLVARFRVERQILATLDHPYIARLLDGGTARDGTPFLAMELVDGERIDAFCDRHELPPAARVDLVLKVCEAVAEAHRKLIVHRDLKPANILVTADGTPKLLDFGIAKLLDPAAGDLTAAETRAGPAPLTPRYASPEQVRGEPITTATDVYSLGVVLYELQSGRSPYRDESLSPHRLPGAICQEEPDPPSTRVTVGDEPAARRPRRRRRPSALARDLDAICLKALRKRPADRYGSVEALAADLRRLREGRPVEARRGSRGYRVARFLRRHRLPVAAALLVALLIAAFTGLLYLQLQEVARERDEAARQRQRAERTRDLLVSVFATADPQQAGGGEVSAREILERGADRVERELAGEPEVRADLLDAIGQAYGGLGSVERAGELLARAVEERRRLDPGGSMALAVSLAHLAVVRTETGPLDEAERLLSESIAIHERHGETRSRSFAAAVGSLGVVHAVRGEFAAAERAYRRAIETAERNPEIPEADRAGDLVNLGSLLHRRGELEAAEKAFRQALERLRRTSGEHHPDLAWALGSLAAVLHSQMRFAEAAAAYEETLALRRRLLGDRHPSVATTLNNLGTLLHWQGEFSAAEGYFRAALDQWSELSGADSVRTSYAYQNLGALALDAGDPAGSLPLLREALRIREAEMDDGDPDLALTRLCLGDALAQLGARGEGEELLRRGLAASTAVVDAPPWRAALARVRLADALAGRPSGEAEASALLAAAVPVLEETFGPEHHWAARGARRLRALRHEVPGAGAAGGGPFR